VKSRGGPARVTANPYGAHDIAGDYSAQRQQDRFLRNNDPSSQTAPLVLDMAAARAGSRRRISPKPWKLVPGRQVDPVQQQRREGVRGPSGRLRARPIRLDAGPGRYFAYGPVRSPDGTRIVLRLFLASTSEQHLYTVRPTGSDLRHVANTQGSEELADWGPHPLAG